MQAAPDLIEREIYRILDILESACEKFDVDKKRSSKDEGEETKSDVRKD